MCQHKVFYGDTFLNSLDMQENQIPYLIELEYYKTYTELGEASSKVYGVEVIKTEHLDTGIEKETEKIELLTKDEALIDRIVKILRDYQVTPIALNDVVRELI